MSAKAAIGFSVHTGWAMTVAVAAPLTAPVLLARTRIDIGVAPESNHIYHVAAELERADAPKHITRCRKTATAKARAALSALMTRLGAEPQSAALVLGRGKIPSSLDDILRSHLVIHGAEGALYRDAILDAAQDLKLKTYAIPADVFTGDAAVALKIPAGSLANWLDDYGKTVGRPWSRDEKDAFLAACIALAKR
jgi:hypothetical protein